MKADTMHLFSAIAAASAAMALGALLNFFASTRVTVVHLPDTATCDREHDLVKVTLETARALSRHHQDSEPYQYKAAGQMETMFRVCFADPDRDSPESPGLLAARLGDLTDDELGYIEHVLDDGWKASRVGQPWRGAVR